MEGYELGERLGEGAFGSVYRCKQRRHADSNGAPTELAAKLVRQCASSVFQ
jgi:serine/threonine protein kinase|tara:strand:- start:40 stop:192 length:153 start_codon:yes stop_codon:yes gene_type:complete